MYDFEKKQLITIQLMDYGLSISGAKAAADYLSSYFEMVDKFNISALKDFESVWVKHVLDSLIPLLEIKNNSVDKHKPEKILDIGTGGGFPGVIAALLFEQSSVYLIDSVRKKLGFIEDACKFSGISNIVTIWGRAEELSLNSADGNYRESFDLVISRALGSVAYCVELSSPFVRPGGEILLYRSLAEVNQMNKLKSQGPEQEKLRELELEFHQLWHYDNNQTERIILRLIKKKRLKKKFPRRHSQIKKTPLFDF